MKTAISIPDELFEEIDDFAQKHNYSRSEVFSVAIKEFLKKIKSKHLLDDLNETYSDIETKEDTTLRRKSKEHYAKKVIKEPY